MCCSLKQLFDEADRLRTGSQPLWLISSAGAEICSPGSIRTPRLTVASLQISPSAFAGLGPKIRSLHLESNKMSNVPDMSNFTGLEILNLRDVPFHCDCQLLPLHR